MRRVTASFLLIAALAGPSRAVWAAVDAALERFRTAPLEPETVRALSLVSRDDEAIGGRRRR